MTELTTDPKARALLYKKIADVTAAVSRIPKNGENTFHRYKYATESDITDGLRDLLQKHGLAFLPPSVIAWERSETTKKDGNRGDDLTRVQMQFGLACTETGEVFSAMFWGEGQDGGDKGFYKSYTGAVKYFLMKTFLIATGDDPEQDSGRQAQTAQRPASYQPAQSQPTTAQPATNGAALISEPQRKMLFAIWKEGGFAGELQAWIQETYKYELPALSKKDASAAIELLQKEIAAGQPA
jgi:hypothetical protein